MENRRHARAGLTRRATSERAPRPPAPRLLFCLALLASAVLCPAPRAARAQPAGVGSLAGDLRVDEKRAGGMKPLTYDVILYYLDGRVHSRQKVAGGGRYRFFSVPPGEYDVAVESDSQEVARLRVNIGPSGLMQDIELEWKAERAGGREPVRKQTVSAADFYERPAATQSNFGKAQAALDKKNYEQAEALFKQVIAADAADFQAWTELGTTYMLQGKAGDAEKAYARAAEARPSFFLAQLNLGRARTAQKKFEAAVEPLERAAELQPASADANFLLGEAYLQVKKGSKAVPRLNEAARLGRAEAHLRLATLYNAAGLKERAAAEYEQFLAKSPDHPERKKFEQYISENKKR